MNIGDLFCITGYGIVATASCDYGQVLVLNNNSTHFLVAESEVGGEDLNAQGIHTVQRHPTARLVALYVYGPGLGKGGTEITANECYADALAEMARIALRNCADDDDAYCSYDYDEDGVEPVITDEERSNGPRRR